MKSYKIIDVSIIAGALLGLGGVILVYLGNPANSGICVSCFMENIAGALQLHNDLRMSYIRPELLGFLLGSFLIALLTHRFRVRGGSTPVIRFFMGFFIIVGCAVFIGCPIKMILRLAAGDLTAVAATLGLIFGVWLGVGYIKAGFALDQDREQSRINGFVYASICTHSPAFLIARSLLYCGRTKRAGGQARPSVCIAIDRPCYRGIFSKIRPLHHRRDSQFFFGPGEDLTLRSYHILPRCSGFKRFFGSVQMGHECPAGIPPQPWMDLLGHDTGRSCLYID